MGRQRHFITAKYIGEHLQRACSLIARTGSLTIWGAALCCLISAAPGAAQEKAEIPRGYEAAAPAQPRAAARPAAAARALPAPARVQVFAPPVPVLPPAQAAPARQNAPVWRAAPAAQPVAPAEGQSVLDVLNDALGEAIDPHVLALENKFLPQAEPLLKSELAFIKRVCQPDREQYQAVANAARSQLRPAVREYAVMANKIQRGQARADVLSGPQPDTVFRKLTAEIVKAKLQPDQVKRYEAECAARTARRKHAVVMNLIVRLDEELGLTPEQRSQLIASLTKSYDESWEQWIRFLHSNTEFVPQMPQNCVLPVLNKEQRDVWMRLSKTRVGTMFGVFPFQAIAVIDEKIEWEDSKNGR